MGNLIRVQDFSPEELAKWHEKLLEDLVYFRDFCDSHNLRFYLSAGTLLGAIRHKGFIPWDGDIDVQMPRKDYEKLFELWEKDADKSKFRCERTDKDKCIRFPMAVVRNVNTTCILSHSVNDDICQGVKIDIEFLDGVPNGKLARKINEICAMVSALLRTERLPNYTSKSKRIVSKIILTLLPTHRMRWYVSKIFDNRLKKYDFDGDYEYVRYSSTPVRKRSAYSSVLYADFEGYKMPIPVGYDEILKAYYGDYMQLPPEDKRFSDIVNIVFYDLDHSYLDYKGIYYCAK